MNKSDTIAVIRSLLSSTDNSYTIYGLNREFKNETGVDIPLFGYGNISDFLNSIPDTVKLTGIYPIQRVSLVTNKKSAHIVSLVKRQKKNGPKNKFSPRGRSFYRAVETNHRVDEVVEPKRVLEGESLDESKYKLTPCSVDEFEPSRTMSWMQGSIPDLDVRRHIQVGQYVEVCPCLIYTPDKFYFHLRKFKKKFQNFIKKMQMFYAVHQEIPHVADDIVNGKQPCAVYHRIFSEAKWYRAEIQENIDNSRFLVNFVDYGNSMEISKENIKYLHPIFQLLPRQAILGSLANIKPLKNQPKWSRGSIRRFHHLAFEKDLIGGIVNIKDGCIGMALSSTGDSEVHINDALVKEGYAEFDIHSSRCDIKRVFNKTSSCKTELKSNGTNIGQDKACFFISDHCDNTRLKKLFLT